MNAIDNRIKHHGRWATRIEVVRKILANKLWINSALTVNGSTLLVTHKTGAQMILNLTPEEIEALCPTL
jgi:hypothetical protein